MQDIAKLVQAAQSGNQEAYATLIQHFLPMAYATAYRHLGDPHLAEDLVQEALIEAFIHLPQLKNPVAFPGWFRQIIFHQCTRLLRQANIQYTSLEAVSEDLFTENNPEDIAVEEELQATVRSAVSALPQHERLVTALFYGRRYSYHEISAILHLPLSTIKKRLHSARNKLKAHLQASLNDAIAAQTKTGANGALLWLTSYWRWSILSFKKGLGEMSLLPSKPALGERDGMAWFFL